MLFRYEPRTDYLFVETSGAFDPGDARRCIEEMMGICREQSLGSILIDARSIPDIVSIANRFDLGTFLAAQRSPVRVAVLVAQPQVDFTKTLEHTAVNRGAPTLTTASLDDAMSFLDLK